MNLGSQNLFVSRTNSNGYDVCNVLLPADADVLTAEWNPDIRTTLKAEAIGSFNSGMQINLKIPHGGGSGTTGTLKLYYRYFDATNTVTRTFYIITNFGQFTHSLSDLVFITAIPAIDFDSDYSSGYNTGEGLTVETRTLLLFEEIK